jgi:hypothetical protein
MKKRWSPAGSSLLAFFAGVFLYQFAVHVGGILAVIAIPRDYFEWFGRSRVELALAVLQLTTFAIPITLLFAGGTLAVHWLLRAPPAKPFLLSFVAGIAACFTFWTAASVLFLPELPPGANAYPVSVLFKLVLIPPWWSASSALAPWAGLALAGWLIARAHRR